MWYSIWQFVIQHPEIFAVLLGWFFASGQTWFFARLYPKHWATGKKQLISIFHSAIAAFIYTFILWGVMDHDADAGILIFIGSFGCAISTPMIQEIVKAFLNARLQSIQGKGKHRDKPEGILKMTMRNLIGFKSK